ncbi:restriction endonuclease [Defluviimonas sp. WL0075]|uniref:Restriction endonuclease n=1 Tax=Albidovulum sediminicola TaxID=2984331 RepID=A0ABT2Z158_9RHOB|nr:restriction endonuclease [Defluviimonas sp. WL0075]MCV2864837.1 restriction endonuclease [Defluviimonas sp. WL0075]
MSYATTPSGDVSIGIQTKLYSSPASNKAVQEAHAGKIHYGLDKAAVLSSAGFTASATDLAKSTGVILLSQYDIPMSKKIPLGEPDHPLAGWK